MNYIRLTLHSLKNRALTTSLTVLSIGLSIGLFFGVERVRTAARESFEGTISGAQLLVGARTGGVQLLLYSIFHIGDSTNNVSYQSFKDWSGRKGVLWTIPFSLGDSHRGYRVVGTNENFYKYYKFRDSRSLEFTSGAPNADLFDVVLGSEVAEKLHYGLGEKVLVSHGVAAKTLESHEDKPFTVRGILKRTGTPIDRSLFISLEGMEAIHIDWKGGYAPSEEERISADRVRKMKIKVDTVTAFLVGLQNRSQVLTFMRNVNDYKEEPLTAVVPAYALQQLWRIVGYAEDALRIISVFVVLVGITGMILSIYTTLNERRREMSILRSLGARSHHILLLLVSEAFLLTVAGCITGIVFVYALLGGLQPIIEDQFGIFIPVQMPTLMEFGYLGCVLAAGILAGLIPAWTAYRNALHDGLSVRV
ncbi:MAG TPA: ABC transporter permease [Leptospiraceae bacterium]|nr:ABC transporter permease [Leptospirales bacterium]HMX56939.1 ABC transporter permease [Leptospiraceae bacterium]HMY45404.1 ABC transporter permease [Leptospiraceae bacterium]HNE23082.1 ABC transporter permease [Leptospiraceae bacterium]HNJ02696.1 ABC transporter permease [Leptospiraceae bacterium]